MTQSIRLWGATYSNVPAVDLPKSTSGTARFSDASVTTAVESDVASGKIFLKADGSQAVGTGSGGGGGGDVQVGYSDAETSSDSASISFIGLNGEPTAFLVLRNEDVSLPSGTPYTATAVVYDGTDVHAQTLTNTNNAQASYDGSSFSKSYANGTLTITSSGANFKTGEYLLSYTYSGTAGNIQTEDVQVGSGATSITFTNLEDEPVWWACIFKSDFSTSSGYQRVMCVTDYDGEVGQYLDSSMHKGTPFSASYNNGSFTISSTGTNNGGYFHQPGYYQLTYAVSGDQTLQTKTVTPTESTQNVTADTGYTALKKVVVNPIPSSYVQPTATQGATTYRPSTSAQTIASGTYLTGTQTISAVSQTNLTAGNIKSGTTISISNGQSNIWSVTGTYTGGGGGDSKNTQIVQNNSTRITATSYTKACGTITVSKSGTYDIYWCAYRTSTSGTWGTQWYKNGTAQGTAQTTFSNSYYQAIHLTNISLEEDDEIDVYGRSRGSNYYLYVGQLTIIEQ